MVSSGHSPAEMSLEPQDSFLDARGGISGNLHTNDVDFMPIIRGHSYISFYTFMTMTKIRNMFSIYTASYEQYSNNLQSYSVF